MSGYFMISVIVPMYNESENVERCIAEIKKTMEDMNDKWEIIAVDDGSKDDTYKKLSILKGKIKNLKILKHKKNLGPGASFRNGFKKAVGDVLLTIDCDLSFSPKNIPKLVYLLKDADIVIGSQYMKGGDVINVPLQRKFISKVANIMDKIFLGVNLTSLSSFFVAYKPYTVKNLKIESNGFDAQTEIITKLYWAGYKIKEIPCQLVWDEKRKGSSKLKIFKEIKNKFVLWFRLLRVKNEYIKKKDRK